MKEHQDHEIDYIGDIKSTLKDIHKNSNDSQNIDSSEMLEEIPVKVLFIQYCWDYGERYTSNCLAFELEQLRHLVNTINIDQTKYEQTNENTDDQYSLPLVLESVRHCESLHTFINENRDTFFGKDKYFNICLRRSKSQYNNLDLTILDLIYQFNSGYTPYRASPLVFKFSYNQNALDEIKALLRQSVVLTSTYERFCSTGGSPINNNNNHNIVNNNKNEEPIYISTSAERASPVDFNNDSSTLQSSSFKSLSKYELMDHSISMINN
ncbi:hypothetical protein PPL_08747 [Heterostelium album PN500]|uniref:Uncharacterized protein n=1 Tax=Heterostelium pallidum (strain ATCC 26659 / Pp 5 / PN500) TaxID=670386 RepID=D3BJL9_HETP5|nr:hypothetical protein PPL_08747 [Heterostelium album PN500]EFA78099.1 hypothetical protein PPL_08747 [Heterostelium album PN500]|eukprot:XP_020430226.1 hypothetical protein PPL_08747 [Heterostelium album PN500]